MKASQPDSNSYACNKRAKESGEIEAASVDCQLLVYAHLDRFRYFL